jgi:hypothetical protein
MTGQVLITPNRPRPTATHVIFDFSRWYADALLGQEIIFDESGEPAPNFVSSRSRPEISLNSPGFSKEGRQIPFLTTLISGLGYL